MAPKYRLVYFNNRGRAEASRYIFAYAKVPYDDVRITKEEWPKLKNNQPFGKVPVLEVDGVIISETRAINRFLAREFGLAGKNNLESARCDMIMSAFGDALSGLHAIFMEKDPAKKEELKQKFLNETIPPFLNLLEKQLQSNGGKYFVGDSFTWPDLSIACVIHSLKLVNLPMKLDNCTGLNALVIAVHNIPEIKEWIEKRPKTEF